MTAQRKVSPLACGAMAMLLLFPPWRAQFHPHPETLPALTLSLTWPILWPFKYSTDPMFRAHRIAPVAPIWRPPRPGPEVVGTGKIGFWSASIDVSRLAALLAIVWLLDMSVPSIWRTTQARFRSASPPSKSSSQSSTDDATKQSESGNPHQAPYEKLSPEAWKRVVDQVDRQIEAGILKPEQPSKASYAKLSPDEHGKLLDQIDRQVQAGTLRPEPPEKDSSGGSG
jgi:hypothetical protein